MAIIRTIDLLPDYLDTTPNERFLSSTLDRLVSDPKLKRFNGYVGRQYYFNAPIGDPYLEEGSDFRQNYQLEPAFVYRDRYENVTGVNGFKELLATLGQKNANTTRWDRLLTEPYLYNWNGFIDLDKLVHYEQYEWVPEGLEPVEISNSDVPLTDTFNITKDPRTNVFRVEGYSSNNPTLTLARGGVYDFVIDQTQFDNTALLRQPKTVTVKTVEAGTDETVYPVAISTDNNYLGGSSLKFSGWDHLNRSTGVTTNYPGKSWLEVSNTDEFRFDLYNFTIECSVYIPAGYEYTNDKILIGSWRETDILNSSFALKLMKGPKISFLSPYLNTFGIDYLHNGVVKRLSFDGNLATNRWHHIAVVRNGSYIYLYLDGSRVESFDIQADTIPYPNFPITIGADVEGNLPFDTYLDELRVSSRMSRYLETEYNVPTNNFVNDSETTLLIHFDGVDNAAILDDATSGQSQVWIQTHAGIDGTIPSNPSLSSREILGAVNNGISSGTISLSVPTLEAQSFYSDMPQLQNSIGQELNVDLATDLKYNEINNAVYSTFVTSVQQGENQDLTSHRGGIDGIKDIDGKLLIFVQDYTDGWESGVQYESDGYEIEQFDQVYPIPSDQWFNVWQVRVNDEGIIKVVPYASFPVGFKTTVLAGNRYRNTSWYKNQQFGLTRIPLLSSMFNRIFIQDSLDAARLIALDILDQDSPAINVEEKILGKRYYKSPNGVELVNGLIVKFTPNTLPEKYANTDESWYVEGVGTSITLTPASELVTPEIWLEGNNENPDFVTINRASLDRNGWSRLNRWFHRTAVETSVAETGIRNTSIRAKRPIIEFISDLFLFNHGTIGLKPITYIDFNVTDALSNIHGTPFATLADRVRVDGQEVQIGDTILFAADTDPDVRNKIWQVNKVDVDGENTFVEKPNVVVATTGPITLSGIQIIDSVTTLDTGDRILVKDQLDAAENGIYVMDAGAWTRSTDTSNTDPSMQTAWTVYVPRGVVNGNKYYKFTPIFRPADTITFIVPPFEVGVDPIIFEESGQVGAVVQLVPMSGEGYDTTSFVSSVVVLDGDSYKGTTWRFTDTTWIRSQEKTSLNVSPLFDVYDINENSYGNTSVYLGSNFGGSTLFEYVVGTGEKDPILGFPVTYANIANLGDLTFAITYDTDTFVYQNDVELRTLATVDINHGRPMRWNNGVATRYNPWGVLNVLNELYQNTVVTGQQTITVKAPLLKKDVSELTYPLVKVLVNNQPMYEVTDFEISSYADKFVVSLVNPIKETDIVQIKYMSPLKLEASWYDVPNVFEVNPFNEKPETLTLSTINSHAIAVYNNVKGLVPDNYSLYGIDISNVPGNIILHSAVAQLSTQLMSEPAFDVDAAIRSAADDYILFRQKFLQVSEQIADIENLTRREAVDAILTSIVSSKNTRQSWFASDMVPIGGNVLTYIINDTEQDIYDISFVYDETVAGNKSILPYLNDRQLIRNKEYAYQAGESTIQILATLSVNDVLTIIEVENTDGSYVPATPTKLGLYPSFEPEIYTDFTYQQPTVMIRGHDGSQTKSFEDYRDELLLELETRIYNNLKVSPTSSDLLKELIPIAGAFRDLVQETDPVYGSYTLTEYNAILKRFFYEWVAVNNVDFRKNTYYSSTGTNNWTTNWASSSQKVVPSNSLGYWRGIYNYFYDTDYPHIRPWEMLGFAKKPDWWDDEYGVAPYTGTNLVMWGDIEQGYVRGEDRYLPMFARSGITQVIPVDQNGNLKNPNESTIKEPRTNEFDKEYTFGDGAPAENAWRKSSIYPFALLRTLCLMQPIISLGMFWDVNSYKPDAENRFMFDLEDYCTSADVKFSTVDEGVRKQGISNYSIEYLRRQGKDTATIKETFDFTQVNLVYNMAGFSDQSLISVLVEQNSPQATGSSVKLTNQDFELFLAENADSDLINYSGVIVSKSANGWKVYGYDLNYPFFKILPSNVYNLGTTITAAGYNVKVFKDFGLEPAFVPYGYEFSTRQLVSDFLISYGRYLESQGFLFQALPDLGKESWIDVIQHFLEWSAENWSIGSLITLNPSVYELTLQLTNGTVRNLYDRQASLVLDINKNPIDPTLLDVYRAETNVAVKRIGTEQPIAGFFGGLVNFEHKLVLKNITDFNVEIYHPTNGERLQRIRLDGQKTAEWNGTLHSPGFMLVSNKIDEWESNKDYIKGSIVKFKNQTFVALSDVIGGVEFQNDSFSIITQTFNNGLIPSLGNKAVELENAYNLEHRSTIDDISRLRASSIAYDRPRAWLDNLGIDLESQTEFFRGFLKDKGSNNTVIKFGRAGSDHLLADFAVREEWAIRTGDYGASDRLSDVEITLRPNTIADESYAVEFVDNTSPVYSELFQYKPTDLYKRPRNWRSNFIRLVDSESNLNFKLQDAGPVLPQDIDNIAKESRVSATKLNYSAADIARLKLPTFSDIVKEDTYRNIFKHVTNGNAIWIAYDKSVEKSNKWNVIRYLLSTAAITAIEKQETKTIRVYLNRLVPELRVGYYVGLQITSKELDLNIAGVFEIKEINDAPTDTGLMSFDITLFKELSIDLQTFPIPVKGLYTYYSLRSDTIVDAELEKQLIRATGIPAFTHVYVDTVDDTGWAYYQYMMPYVDAVTNGRGDIGSDGVEDPATPVTEAMAWNLRDSLLWVGRSSALSGIGQVVVKSITDSVNTSGILAPKLDGASSTVGVLRTDTVGFGTDIVSMPGNAAVWESYIAITAPNSDQVYIERRNQNGIEFLQLLGSTDFANVGNDYYPRFGKKIAASKDGNWLFIASDTGDGSGPADGSKVSAYRRRNNGIVLTGVVTVDAPGSNLFHLDFTPVDIYALRVTNLTSGRPMIPVKEFTLSGSDLTFDTTYGSFVPGDTIGVTQLQTYYSFVDDIVDDYVLDVNEIRGDFGNITVDEYANYIAISAPNRHSFNLATGYVEGAGQVRIYNRTVEKFEILDTSPTMTLAAIPNANVVDVYFNDTLLENITDYTIVGDVVTIDPQVFIDLATTAEGHNIVSVESNRFILTQTIDTELNSTLSANTEYIQLGESMSLQNNSLVVSAPRSAIRYTASIEHHLGIVNVLTLDSSYKDYIEFDIDGLSYSTPIRINDFLIYDTVVPVSSWEEYCDNINQTKYLQYTGVTATPIYDTDNTTVIRVGFTIDRTKFTTGIAPALPAVLAPHPTFELVAEVYPEEKIKNFGYNVKWLSNDNFALTSQYETGGRVEDKANDFSLDGGNTTFSGVVDEEATVATDRIYVYQLLRTNESENIVDRFKLTRVGLTECVSDNTQSTVIFDGSIGKLFVANRLSVSETNNLKAMANYQNSHGWNIIRREAAKVDQYSIKKAYLYDKFTSQKIIDLDIIDSAKGLFPNSAIQALDFISDFDPANYNFSQWQPGSSYSAGDYVIYNGSVNKANVNSNDYNFDSLKWDPIDYSNHAIVGATKWGETFVGKTWWKTSNLRTVNYEQGDWTERVVNWNSWFPNSVIEIYEWVSSSVPPEKYDNSDVNGHANTTLPFVKEVVKNNDKVVQEKYYFWVTGKTKAGPLHAVSTTRLRDIIFNPSASGISYIAAIDRNKVMMRNVDQFIKSDNIVLHIEYEQLAGTTKYHSEYLLLSEDGENRWLNTTLFDRLVDSLSSTNENGDPVPDPSLAVRDRFGIYVRPRQSMFKDRITALKIYFDSINEQLLQYPIVGSTNIESLFRKDSIPTTNDYNYVNIVPDRDTLALIDTPNYSVGDMLLVEVDYLVHNGWSVVQLDARSRWITIAQQKYDLTQFWKYVDWTSSDVSLPLIPKFTIAGYGWLSSIDPTVGDLIEVMQGGDGNRRIIRLEADGSYTVVFSENGTIQFTANLYDFKNGGIGYDAQAYDNANFDNDPAIEIRKILVALNTEVLIGQLYSMTEKAFFAMLRYATQEQNNIDWLFRTSFITVDHNVKNLDYKTNYRKDDVSFVEQFITETKPYHVKLREYTPIFSSTDVSAGHYTDFDIPALFDASPGASILNPSNIKDNASLPASEFSENVGVVKIDRFVYTTSTGIPTKEVYPVEIPGVSPNPITNQNWKFKIPINGIHGPTHYTIKDLIGVAIDGVPFYTPISDKTEVLAWNTDSQVIEEHVLNLGNEQWTTDNDGSGPVLIDGVYKYIQDPKFLYTKNPAEHSPILGYALDGYPIYGPYGYKNSNGTGGIIRNTSSYRLSPVPRLNKTVGNYSVVNGVQLAEYGLATGEYIDDYEYVAGAGTLDEFNGRTVVTPEYPLGTYAYFITVDSNDVPVYPYIVGPQFKGVPYDVQFVKEGNLSVPVIVNGHINIGAVITPNHPLIGYVRSPTGLVFGDDIKLQLGVYKDWSDNYTYSVDSIDVYNKGNGYTSTPIINIVGGGGTGATAIAVVQLGQITSIDITNAGSGYTSQPTVEIIGGLPGDSPTEQAGAAYAQLTNGTIRKIATKLVFERTTYGLEMLDNGNPDYNINDIVYDADSDSFVRIIGYE